MSTYFSNFPTIRYDDILVRDITKRNNFITDNLSDPLIFLPYTVKEGDKPEDVAHLYYGSMDYTWIVLLANNINDPYLEWYLPDDDFNQYLIQKYTEQSGKTGYEVIDWLRNETIEDNILYYYAEIDEDDDISELSTL